MIDEITIRPERQEGFKEVFELHSIAFGRNNEAKLVDALRKNRTAFVPKLSVVASCRDKIIGHILFTIINIKSDNGNLHESLGLAPMAVRPEFQKCGVGGQLIRTGLEVAKMLGFKSVIFFRARVLLSKI